MSALELPETVDVERLVSHAGVLEGQLAAERLTRLAEVYQVQSALSARLAFDRDSQGRARVGGQLTVALGTTCQRCLQPLTLDLHREFESVLCTEAEALTLDADPVADPEVEPVVIGPDGFRLASFLEDEALLSCPMIPHHEFGVCRAPGEAAPAGDPPAAGTRKPFANLDKLLKEKPAEGESH
jgi:uncharacterized protein